jgi:N-acetylmuramoyl-L-alanine amidase
MANAQQRQLNNNERLVKSQDTDQVVGLERNFRRLPMRANYAHAFAAHISLSVAYDRTHNPKVALLVLSKSSATYLYE